MKIYLILEDDGKGGVKLTSYKTQATEEIVDGIAVTSASKMADELLHWVASALEKMRKISPIHSQFLN